MGDRLLDLQRGASRNRSSSSCVPPKILPRMASDVESKVGGDNSVPQYDLKLIKSLMGKSLPPKSMKLLIEKSVDSVGNCEFLTDSEKEMAKQVAPRFFSHVTKKFPQDLCKCKSDSVPDLMKLKQGQSDASATNSKSNQFYFNHVPTLEEFRSFSEVFKMPKNWSTKKEKSSAEILNEMEVYLLRLKERGPVTEEERADQMNLLKSSLGMSKTVEVKVSKGMKKRRNSVYKLFGRASPTNIKSGGGGGGGERGEEEEAVSDYAETVDENGIRYIKYGTLGQIMSHLIEFTMQSNMEQKKAGSKMFVSFIQAYQRVETATNLLAWLRNKYFEATEEDGGGETRTSQDESSRRMSVICSTNKKNETFIQGILGFIMMWLEQRFVPDFTTPYMEGQSRKTPLYGELLQFLNKMSHGHRTVVKIVLDQNSSEGVGVQHTASNLLGLSRIKEDLNSPKKKKKEKMQRNTSSLFFNVMSQQRSQKLPPNFSFLDLTVEEVSELLTAEDSRLLSNVAVDEFAGKAWTPKLDSGIGVLTHRWNKLGRWVASEVVNTKSLKHRVEILKRFISIMDTCFKLNNFFTTMSIISGLNHSAVQRMKKSWRALPERHQKELAHLEEELSFSQSFRRYRELLADAVEKEKACIPFLAVHTKDMLFITEAKGNPEFVSPGVLNFEKLSLIGGIVSLMKACQKLQSKYEVVVMNQTRHETIKNFIGRLPNTLPEESLYPSSLEHEPPDS